MDAAVTVNQSSPLMLGACTWSVVRVSPIFNNFYLFVTLILFIFLLGFFFFFFAKTCFEAHDYFGNSIHSSEVNKLMGYGQVVFVST